MKQALRLAALGRGTTSPNPMVGAVVVANRKVVGKGYHQIAGGPHAEVLALQAAKSRSRHATLYVTLEPCCHTEKRTPPCVPVVIQAGIRRVVVAMRDPNPHVAGRGIRQLRQAGIEVEVGCLKQEAQTLNVMYIHWTQTGRPFVILKAAMTLDGKIATASGESKWITGTKARAHVHQLRSHVDVVAVGVGTILKDDPLLTARLSSKHRASKRIRQPLRLIFDSHLRIPLTARVLQTLETSPTAVATTHMSNSRKIDQLRGMNVQVLILPQKHYHVSIRRCLEVLGKMGMTSLMVEGGSELNAGFVRENLVNRVYLYVAPILLGGQDAKGVIGGFSPKRLRDRLVVSHLQKQMLGKDLLITGDLRS